MKYIIILLLSLSLVSCASILPKQAETITNNYELSFFKKPIGIKGEKGVSTDTHEVINPVVVPRSKTNKTEVVTLTPKEWNSVESQINLQNKLIDSKLKEASIRSNSLIKQDKPKKFYEFWK